MAASRPIVASDFAALREVLAHEVNAVLVQPDRAEPLLAGIDRVLHDPALASRIAEQARRDVEAFSWSGRAEQLLAQFLAKQDPTGLYVQDHRPSIGGPVS
jgi:starch synthase